MKILILQHQDSVTAGTTIEWIEKNHYDYSVHQSHIDGNIDLETPYDVLVICGGTANVDQEDEFPWLANEKKFIKAAIAKNKKIVGLCLGGQLLAEALGGEVFKAPHWETGWHKIKLLDEKNEVMVFQWHGYQFISPPGSIKIAENECCPHQGFKFGENVLAFQFHPEATVDWVKYCAVDEHPVDEKYMQNDTQILDGLKYQESMKEWYFKQLDGLLTFG